MSILSQLRRGGGLGGLAVRDLRPRGSVRNIDIELDQELHDVLQNALPKLTLGYEISGWSLREWVAPVDARVAALVSS
jgi:hypothetical protein